MLVVNQAMQLVLIGIHHYQQMLILKGNYSNEIKKRSFIHTFNFICRELFGVHPTGINFELYNDIPVESSHMEHSPIDTVCISNILFY
jgi:hypothetical protein